MHRTRVARTGGIAVLLLAVVSVASAQDAGGPAARNIHRLGGSTALYKPALTSAASLKRMGGDPRAVTNIRTVLGQGGVPALSDQVVAAMTGATTSVRGGLCSEASPADGTVVECDVQPGQRMQWMAYRPTGGARLGLLENIRWAGKQSFRAFLFRVTADSRTYTFIVPKVCGNLTLMDVHDVARPARVEPIAVPEPAAPPPAAVVEPVPAPPAALAPPVPVVEPSPSTPTAPPAPVAPMAAASAGRGVPFFVDLLGGKDRRVRPIGTRTTTDGSSVRANAGSSNVDFAQCSPLVGIKVGVSKRFEGDWDLAGAAGVALSLVHASDKVRQHEVFVDVEANKYLGRAFVGTGLSLWDVTHSDTFTPAWMGHVGLPLGSHARHPASFLVEGRLFFDHVSDVRNNYQFWAGLRVHL